MCKRCAKSRRECTGFRQAFAVVHSENAYASGQKKRPRGPRSTWTSGCSDCPTKLIKALPRSPYDIKTEAVMYYVQCHLERIEDAPPVVRVASDDLLSLWMLKGRSPILEYSVSSVALAVFSQTKRLPEAAVEASSQYQKLLRELQVTLPCLDQSNIEPCLLAILFMSLYEDSVYRPTVAAEVRFLDKLCSCQHQDGLLAILKYWKDNFSSRQPPTSVIKHVRRATIKWSLMRSLAMPEWMEDGAVFGEHGLELEYDRVMTRIMRLRYRLNILFPRDSDEHYQPDSEELLVATKALNDEARDLDRAIQEWSTHTPDSWLARQHTLPNRHHIPDENFYSIVVHSHQSPAYAAAWMRYYSTRMLINSTRLRVLQHLSPASLIGNSLEDQRQHCLSNIQNMGDVLASTVPFVLERFKISEEPPCSDVRIVLNTKEEIKPHLGGLIVYPVTIAASLRFMEGGLKTWFQERLVDMGRVMGYAVFQAALSGKWLEF